MTSRNFITQQLKRLGAVPGRFDGKTPIRSLVSAVSGLTCNFRGNVKRYRSMLAHYRIKDFDDFSERELEQEMPLITGLRFVDSSGFYEDWQSEMPNVTRNFTPFAHDDYYFYFLAKNRKSEIEPAVYAIDHEEQDEKPTRHYELTAGMLLASIEPEPSKPAAKKGGTPRQEKPKRNKKIPVGQAEISELIQKSSSDGNLSWNRFEVHGTHVIQLEISHEEFSEIARALAVFWECLFLSLSDRQINEIAICDCQSGFNFYVKTTPQIRERRFEVRIDRMENDFDDAEMMEKYWRSAEIGLHKSNVLQSYRDRLHSDFELAGTALANKKFRREFKPRKR